MFDGDSDKLRSLALVSPGRVPAEFTGMARDLRRRVLVDDERASALMFDICHPVQLRLRQHARMQPETLAGIARRWRIEVPARYRLSLDAIRHSAATAIIERRVCASLFRNEEWEADYRESGLSILLVELAADKKRTSLRYRTIAAVLLHGLARWCQRQREPSAQLLLDDLRAFAERIVALHEHERDFVAPTPRGVWVGHRVLIQHHRTNERQVCASARTWLSDEMIANAA